MAQILNRQQLADIAVIHDEDALRAPTTVDRNFGLPGALYGTTVGLFLSYLALMAFGFSSPGLIIPMAIFAFFIVAGFGIPTIWVRMKPENTTKALSWSRFASEGIQTETGPLDARAAAAQVLILPGLLFVWGVLVVAIAAFVRG